MSANYSNIFLGFLLSLACVAALNPALASTIDAGAIEGFSCSGGQARGQLITSAQYICSDDAGVFGFFICAFQNILGEIFGNMYCGITDALRVPLGAALTLCIVLAGACFLTGIIQFSQGELIKLALKIALVWTFATNAEYGINIAYFFFMSATQETISVIFATLEPSEDAVAAGAASRGWDSGYAIRYIDEEISALFSSITSSSSAEATDANKCDNYVIAALAITAAAAPPIALFGFSLIFAVVGAILQFLVGYLLALIGITFMMVLSPIFLSFALFKQTYQYFNKWLTLTISFSIQMVFVFAFLAFFMQLGISEKLSSYSDIFIHDENFAKSPASSVEMLFPPCTLCKLSEQKVDGKLVCAEPKEPVPFTSLFKEGRLLAEVATSLLGLLIIILALKQMIGLVPELAAHIANTPVMKVGSMASGLPGAAMVRGARSGFMGGYEGAEGGPINRMMGGLTGAARGATGARITQSRRQVDVDNAADVTGPNPER